MKLHFKDTAEETFKESQKTLFKILFKSKFKFVSIPFIIFSILLVAINLFNSYEKYFPYLFILGLIVFVMVQFLWGQKYLLKKWNIVLSEIGESHEDSIFNARLSFFAGIYKKKFDTYNKNELFILQKSIDELEIGKPKYRSWSSIIQTISLGGTIGISLIFGKELTVIKDFIIKITSIDPNVELIIVLLLIYLTFISLIILIRYLILEYTNLSFNRTNHIIKMLYSLQSRLHLNSLDK
jgi:hypothetical protein